VSNFSKNLPEKQGIYPVYKPVGSTSFNLIRALRKKIKEQCIGHGGTLDPFAEGLLILLVGKPFTKQFDTIISLEKEYETVIHLGIETDTYDLTGEKMALSDKIPSLEEVEEAIKDFQGETLQMSPVYSAKKIQGNPLYKLARKDLAKALELKRVPSKVSMKITLLDYQYPDLSLKITSSKGTYIRSLAHDLGEKLGTYGHLKKLIRTRIGNYKLADCLDGREILCK